MNLVKHGFIGRELYSNNISGPIPSELGNLTNLVSLDLYLNSFSGPIPESLGRLSKLRFLYVYRSPCLFFIYMSLYSCLCLSLHTLCCLWQLRVGLSVLLCRCYAWYYVVLCCHYAVIISSKLGFHGCCCIIDYGASNAGALAESLGKVE